jgi:hypothetical protein
MDCKFSKKVFLKWCSLLDPTSCFNQNSLNSLSFQSKILRMLLRGLYLISISYVFKFSCCSCCDDIILHSKSIHLRWQTLTSIVYTSRGQVHFVGYLTSSDMAWGRSEDIAEMVVCVSQDNVELVCPCGCWLMSPHTLTGLACSTCNLRSATNLLHDLNHSCHQWSASM